MWHGVRAGHWAVVKVVAVRLQHCDKLAMVQQQLLLREAAWAGRWKRLCHRMCHSLGVYMLRMW